MGEGGGGGEGGGRRAEGRYDVGVSREFSFFILVFFWGVGSMIKGGRISKVRG